MNIRALATHSKELAALPTFPVGIEVVYLRLWVRVSSYAFASASH